MKQLLESQTVEFKQIWKDEYLRTICAFANSEGGVLYIGLDDNSEILGVENIEELLEILPNKINNRLGLVVDISIKNLDTKNYLEIKVNKTYATISYNGKFYIRSGSNTIELNGGNLTVLPFMQQALAGQLQRFERTEQRADGLHYLLSIYIPHEQGEQVLGFYVLTQDITHRKQLEIELEQHALLDALTGLPNRRALTEQLPKAMARSSRTGQTMALLFMDLAGFKAVNDTYGHDAGNELLQQFAQRVQSLLRGTDTLFRLGGDEFTLILENLAGEAQDA